MLVSSTTCASDMLFKPLDKSNLPTCTYQESRRSFKSVQLSWCFVFDAGLYTRICFIQERYTLVTDCVPPSCYYLCTRVVKLYPVLTGTTFFSEVHLRTVRRYIFPGRE